MGTDERAERVAWNESAFREVNERMRELAADLDREAEFVCECASVSCTQHVHVSVEEYERIRSHGRRFIVAPGHERPEFEVVVAERDGWVVVEKVGLAGVVASDHDPRRA